jgi:alanine racemase
MPSLRDAWAEVDTSAITANVRSLRALTAPGTRFMAVVKADGYGHGSVEAAEASLAGGADRIGVATVEEGVQLRESGIVAPIHLLSEPPMDAMEQVVASDLVPTMFRAQAAGALSAAAVASGSTVRYHLKVDTGMNRIGVSPDDTLDLAVTLSRLPGLEMEGVFTHFATADVPGDWDFERQMERFTRVLEDLRDSRLMPPLAHAANSPATILHPESHLDMVRCGISIYGLHPDPSTEGRVELRPAMSVKARVTNVHTVPTGDGVSYGLTWRAATPTQVATIPLGYADGLHRVLSGRMRVLAGGTSCTQIGRICMDQTMFEIPRSATIEVGDEVVLVGSQGLEQIALEEPASAAGTINYEMACSFALRLPRTYAG